MSAKPKTKESQSVELGPWRITSVRSHILPSEGPVRGEWERALELPQLPEMIFHENKVEIVHSTHEFGLEFCALDALKLIDAHRLPEGIKVAATETWRSARQDCEFIDKEVVKPFDWTFTTPYRGSIVGDEFASLVEATDERIDLERLKIKEDILFYDDVCLFEDELGDNGSSVLSVKIRCMPTSFFVLMRFFMRVDGVMIRMIDTRLYHSSGTNFFLREFLVKEGRFESLRHLPPHLFTNPTEIGDHLKTITQENEKLFFPLPKY